MLNKINETVNSREFQTAVGQVGIAVVSIIASAVVSHYTNQVLSTGLDKLMDKIHNTVTPAE